IHDAVGLRGSAVSARERPPCAGRRPYAHGRVGRNSGPSTSASYLRCRPARRVYRPMRFWPLHHARVEHSSRPGRGSRTREAGCGELPQRGLDRLIVATQVIKRPGLIGEPGGGPGIAGTKAPSRLDRFESLLVAAVEAQPNSEVKMTEREVRVQLDRAARMRYGGPHVASPMACLCEHIFGLRVLT